MKSKKRNSLRKTDAEQDGRNSIETEKQRLLKLLDNIKGVGKGIWDEDAQVYVNKLREDRDVTDFQDL